MKLYVTSTSPYSRIVRILIFEKQLDDRIEVVPAATRTPDSPFYTINVSGRVPYLVHDDGWGIEDSHEVCAYIDQLDDKPIFINEPLRQPLGETDWQLRQLQARATSLIDGVSVWIRELRRPTQDQSATIIEHERSRALRLAHWWERQITHERMRGSINLEQTTLYCALDLDNAIEAFTWRQSCPRLVEFADRFARRESAIKSNPYD